MGKVLKKHKKKFIVLGAVVALLIFLFARANSKAKQLPMVLPEVVERSDLRNFVNLTGTIESENSNKVYTQLTLPVDKNLVEVGDRVKEGDVLCQLDSKSLENTIEQQRASAGASSANSANGIYLAEKQYAQALVDLQDENNATIFQAEQAVTQAEYSLNQAEVALDNSIDGVRLARRNVDDSGWVRDEEVIDSSVLSASGSRDSAYAAYETAKEGVRQAKASLELAKHNSAVQIDALNDSIDTQIISSGITSAAWVGINHLEEDLAKSVVTSPVDGVVTAIYVTEGAPATGLLYVIEDINSLKVSASLKEYDLSLVKLGNGVEIKSDATGETVFDGKLNHIAPTTTKTPTGDNIVGAQGEFESEVKVASKDSSLKIGSKARMNIIYEEKDDVLNVSYEALGQEEIDGVPTTVVYVLEEELEGIYILRAVTVELGMETDFKVEVISKDLKAGDKVITATEGFKAGDRVQINTAAMDIAAAMAASAPKDPNDFSADDNKENTETPANSTEEEASKDEDAVITPPPTTEEAVDTAPKADSETKKE